MKKWVYLFTEGNANMRELLGGKGANLAEMTNIGLPVPQGFTITTEACTQYYEDGRQINDEIQGQIMEYIVKMEEITGKTLKSYRGDVCDHAVMEKIFTENQIDAVIHFAGLKAVGESVHKPIEYYVNNVTGTLNLCMLLRKYGAKKMVFSLLQ